jgi:ADP-ribosyl-[dinitrogen reductase] hydrolase
MSTSVVITRKERILGGLWGSLVGDALGVPVEFKDRAMVQADPVRSMRGHGTHHQPPGTWSDDGALILCTTDSFLNHEFNLDDMGERFVRWMNDGLWTANGEVFDVGGTTSSALCQIAKGTPVDQAGGRSEESNGNGSLMRIIPAAFRFAAEPIESFVAIIENVSAITHAHERSRLACAFYGLVVRQLLSGSPPKAALDSARVDFIKVYSASGEFSRFRRILDDDLVSLPENLIVSTGYVLHTLHASLWCLLTTENYQDCALGAVNLGGDTDTTGCVAGGLAGVAYGMKSIPTDWIGQMARKGDADCLLTEFANLCEQTGSKKAG